MKGTPMAVSRRSFLKGVGFGLAGAALTGAYADYSARTPQLESIELKLKNWKADGLRVAFITDIHVNDADEMVRAQHAAELLAGTRPDILLFGGDCVNTTMREGLDNIPLAMKPFQSLKCPKLAVLGNHDYANGVGAIADALGHSGFLVLKNEEARFGDFHIAGYDDRIGGTIDPSFKPRKEGTISLLHEPDFVDEAEDTVSLQISGHSHGGQICLPFGVPLHTPRGARKYRRGYFSSTKVPLYVSRGVGTIGFKWRLFCPPEVTLLTLRSGG
jgi:uncharacterized protein